MPKLLGSFLSLTLIGLASCSADQNNAQPDSQQPDQPITHVWYVDCQENCGEAFVAVDLQNLQVTFEDFAAPLQPCSDDEYFCFSGAIPFSIPWQCTDSLEDCEPHSWEHGGANFELSQTAELSQCSDGELLTRIASYYPPLRSRTDYYLSNAFGVERIVRNSVRCDDFEACGDVGTSVYSACELGNSLPAG